MGKIKITDLVLRDGHQSLLATRMLTSDMLGIASELDKVGYHSLETWGGATFDSCIRYLNEDPWERIRALKKAMPNTPMQMLLRGQNILGYRHYADDVVNKFVELAAKNGVDIFRVFDALNDTRNLQTAIQAVKANGKHAQGAISYAVTPVHTVKTYVNLAKELKEAGADSICIKDMSGLLKPYDAYELIKAIKKAVNLPIQLHSHATTGMSVATQLKGVEAGADILDTTISSLSMGTSHSPTETLVEILKGTEYDTGLDTKLLLDIAHYFREVRHKYSQFESSFTGADTRILHSQVPGGMLSNLENQLREQDALDKIDEVLEEISKVQHDFGYPPLVTPTSQIVGTQAVFNVLFGKYNKLTGESMDLLTGKYGKTPAKVDAQLLKRALEEKKMEKAIDYRPADDIPNELDTIEAEVKEELGISRVAMEDVLTYALFPQVAIKFFKNRDFGPVSFDDAPKKSSGSGGVSYKNESSEASVYVVNVDGKDYKVTVRNEGTMVVTDSDGSNSNDTGNTEETSGTIIGAPVAGSVFKIPYKDGDMIEAGQTIVILESMKMELEIKSTKAGQVKYLAKVGDSVKAREPIAEVL